MDVSAAPALPPLRVLYVITKANWGGAQRYVYDLAMALHASGMHVSVAYGVPGILSQKLEAAGIPTFAVEGMGRDVRLGADLTAYRGLATLFKQEHPDIVHVNSSKAGILGALAARAAGVPRVIFTAHGWAFNEARPEWQKIILKGIYALLISLADATICVSDAVRRDMAWVPGARKKLKVVRLGVSPTEFKSRDVSREALLPGNPDGIWIGMLAELHPTKRIEDAIEALALLVPAHPELKLIVLGEGEHRATLEALIRERSLEGHAFLRGFVADGSTYLKAFDAFAFPSRTEALGYAALEAGQAGLPVAASNVGGIPEIIDDRKSGLLVPALAPALLAAALEELITNPDEAHRFGEALRERVYTAFSVEGMVSSTRAAYSFP